MKTKSKSKVYAIAIGGDWYMSHGGVSGAGCLQTHDGLFPSTFYVTRDGAYLIADSLLRDFPATCREIGGREVRVVEVAYAMKEAV